MSQTRLGSSIETASNIAIGFAINFVCNLIILPMFGFDIHPGAAFTMGLVYTAISVVRSYMVRRWFNSLRIFHR
jgi:hypothetical protein